MKSKIKLFFRDFFKKNLFTIGKFIGEGFNESTPSLKKNLEMHAINTTANYVLNNMSSSIMFVNHNELLKFAIKRSRPDGLILEFGVYKGRTLNFISKELASMSDNREIWGFDSFEGLPDDWSGYSMTKESFDLKKKIPKLRKDIKLSIGFFDETLPSWVKRNLDDNVFLALIHIDSDLYSSAKVILNNLSSFIKKDTLILFDEYFAYPNWQNHEFLAFKEFVNANNIAYEYLGFYEQKCLVKII
jgi:hypothetical protein